MELPSPSSIKISCKHCHKEYNLKSITQHGLRSKSCKKYYSQDHISCLKEHSSDLYKAKRKIQKAQRYQHQKNLIAKQYYRQKVEKPDEYQKKKQERAKKYQNDEIKVAQKYERNKIENPEAYRLKREKRIQNYD